MTETPESNGKTFAIFLAGVFVLAFLLRLVCVLQYEEHHPNADYLVIDERSYDQWAVSIADGEWLGEEVFFQEPLYPYFLGTLYTLSGGRDLFFVRLTQSVLGALTCVFAGLLAREVFGKPSAYVAAALLAVSTPAIIFPAYLLKPNLFLPLFTLFAWLWVRESRSGGSASRTWVLLGALAGLGALLRGNVLILLPAFALWPIVRARFARSSFVLAVLFAAGAFGVLLPVAVRNQVVGGVFALTTSGAGTNLYGGNNADNPYGIATEFDWVRGIPEHESGDWRREAERRLGRDLDPGEVSSYWMGEVARSIGRDPALHARILFNKLRATLSAYEVPDNHDVGWDEQYARLLSVPWPGFGVLGSLALAGILLTLVHPAGLERRKLAVELALLWAFYLATIVLTVTSMRIRLALVPLLVPFCGWFLVALTRAVRDRSVRTLTVSSIALILSAVIVGTPVFDDDYVTKRLANRDYNLASQLLDQGERFDEVTRIAHELRERYPRSSRVQVLSAEVDFRAGVDRIEAAKLREASGEEGWENERDAGRASIQAALDRLKPLAGNETVNVREKFRLRRLAGWIQLWLENGRAAENHFRAALEFDDEDGDLRLALAQALIQHARSMPADDERAAKITEANDILASLDPESPAVRDLLARLNEL